MTRRLQALRRDRGEEGSALVLALVFLSLFGLLIAAQASWGGAGQHADVTTGNVRGAQYGADGALQGAIARYKTDASGCVADNQPHDFFTYAAPVGTQTVNYTVTCQQAPAPTGGSETPPTDFCASNAAGSDFTVINNAQTSATLSQALRYMEMPSGGNAAGHVAETHYPRVGNNSVDLSAYNRCDNDPAGMPAGASFAKVDLRVSHSETTNGSNQSQSVRIVTTTCPSPGTTYAVVTAKPSGGPSWPGQGYETLDVSNCIKNVGDVNGAHIFYQAQAPCSPSSCGNAADQFDGAVIAVRLKSSPTSSVSTGGTKPGLDFFTDYGNCGTAISNWGTHKVQWTQSGTCAQPPISGVSTEANCAGVTNCGGSSNSNPANYSQVTFSGAANPTTIGDKTSILFSGYNWPTTAPILNVVLRVVHLEQFPNFWPSVTVDVPGQGSCTLDKNSTPALNSAQTSFQEASLVLPAACAPMTPAAMAATTVLYTVTCAVAGGQGAPRCGTGGTSSPLVYVDAVLFDFNYVSGSGPLPGGGSNTNTVTFNANVSSVTKGTVTYDPTDASIDTWHVPG